MTDTIVCGVDRHRKWMLQVVSCDCATGARRDFLSFFNTRSEAETHAEQLISNMKECNMIIRIIRIQAFESENTQNEKEN